MLYIGWTLTWGVLVQLMLRGWAVLVVDQVCGLIGAQVCQFGKATGGITGMIWRSKTGTFTVSYTVSLREKAIEKREIQKDLKHKAYHRSNKREPN